MSEATEQATESAQNQEVAASLMSKCVALEIRKSVLNVQRKTNVRKAQASGDGEVTNIAEMEGAVLTDADPDQVTVHKRILDSPELKQVTKKDGEITRWLDDRSLKSCFRGVKFVPVVLLEEVDERLCEYVENERPVLIEAFFETYPAMKEKAEAELGSLYQESDYPPETYLREKFNFRWQYLTYDTPGRLKQLKRDVWQREKEKMNERLTEAYGEIQQSLRVVFAELVGNMATFLQPDEEGKPRRFKKSSVEKLVGFIELFQQRNVTDDAQLAGLVETAKEMLEGTDAEDLRKDEALRAALADGMGTLSVELKKLTEQAPTRGLLGEDE
jgi:hypothetical protein